MTSEPLHRIRLRVHYDGSGFYGWQLQARERTVQGELERVVSRLANRPTRVHGSGRTDRGVHATGQVAIVDLPARWTAAELRRAMNALLPHDIWVEAAEPAPPRFHPRFDAVARSYVYRVGTTEAARSPFVRRGCWALGLDPDPQLLRRAADAIVGNHSFRTFAKAGQEERGDRCIVTHAEWRAWPGLGVEFHVTANRFLHHMVRYLVGTQVEIGVGRRAPQEMDALLAGAPGLATSPPAPPEGLYLTAVRYPDDAFAEYAAGLPPAPPHP